MLVPMAKSVLKFYVFISSFIWIKYVCNGLQTEIYAKWYYKKMLPIRVLWEFA